MAGNHYRAPTKPLRYERWFECPVTGLRYAESDGVWLRGRLVHPLAVDAPAYREVIYEVGPDQRPRPYGEAQFFLEGL